MRLFFYLFVLPLSAYELAVAAQFRNEAPYLKEWVEYHRMVGVDHFWLYNNSSEDAWEEVLKPYIEEGLVEVFDWPSLRIEFIGYQLKAYCDAIMRAKGNTKWLALIDLDEFLLPMKEATVTECLEKHFSAASAVYASWRMFGTGNVFLEPNEFYLTKLTACSFKSHPRNAVGKTIVRPEWVDIENAWYVHYYPLFPGSSGYLNGNGEEMNFDGTTLLSVTQICDKFLRINHYNLRDENFFHNRRLALAIAGISGNADIYREHYELFSLIKDMSIVNLIKNKYPEMYEKFWKNH